MNNYIPFLKLKQNEIMGIKILETSLQNNLIPFFDFPKEDNITEAKFKVKVQKQKKSIETHLNNISSFYLDNYDISSDFIVNGNYNYKYLLEEFKDHDLIPVIGIDRNAVHMDTVIDCKKRGIITSDNLAIRITNEDFQDFDLVEDDIEEMLSDTMALFNNIELIFDCRLCINHTVAEVSSDIIDFIKKFSHKYTISKIIITGSSIPSSIADIVSTETEVIVDRKELEISSNVINKMDQDIFIGDYTIVSPNYSEVNIPGNVMYNVMTPKIIYSYDKHHFIIRGGALKTHVRGYEQYNDQSAILVSKLFYRGAIYSFGDNFIDEKSRNIGKNVTPGSILKPAINAHITFMMSGYIY